MKRLNFLLLFIFLASCDEFYNDDFLEDPVQEQDNVSYSTSLTSTDPNLTGTSGTASIEVNGDVVNLNLRLQGLPPNLSQFYYLYVLPDCTNYATSVPANSGETRSYQVSETLSLSALANDLRVSGAAQGEGDSNLEGKSLVVKAFSNFGTAGSSALTVACGEIVTTETDESSTGGFTGTTAAGVTGTTAAGVTGTTAAGVTGTTAAGVTGTTTAGLTTGSNVGGTTITTSGAFNGTVGGVGGATTSTSGAFNGTVGGVGGATTSTGGAFNGTVGGVGGSVGGVNGF